MREINSDEAFQIFKKIQQHISGFWQNFTAARQRTVAQMPPLELTHSIESQNRLIKQLVFGALIAGAFIAGVFIYWPRLDLSVMSSWFYEDGFIISEQGVWAIIRRLVMNIYAIYYIAIIILSWIAWAKPRIVLGLHPIEWLYLTLSSLAGPLLLTNLILQEFVGRPRPVHVHEFGGGHAFKGVFEAGGGCVYHCSFVSGEVSSMAMIFVSLLLIGKPSRKIFALAIVPALLLSAWLRLGMGGHFPTDVIYAIIFMTIVAAILYRVIVLNSSYLKKQAT